MTNIRLDTHTSMHPKLGLTRYFLDFSILREVSYYDHFHILPFFRKISGKGVTVGIVSDKGPLFTHSDLQNIFNANASYDFVGKLWNRCSVKENACSFSPHFVVRRNGVQHSEWQWREGDGYRRHHRCQRKYYRHYRFSSRHPPFLFRIALIRNILFANIEYGRTRIYSHLIIGVAYAANIAAIRSAMDSDRSIAKVQMFPRNFVG